VHEIGDFYGDKGKNVFVGVGWPTHGGSRQLCVRQLILDTDNHPAWIELALADVRAEIEAQGLALVAPDPTIKIPASDAAAKAPAAAPALATPAMIAAAPSPSPTELTSEERAAALARVAEVKARIAREAIGDSWKVSAMRVSGTPPQPKHGLWDHAIAKVKKSAGV